ncbi:MAG: UPF0164 family protein [candidate division FCPU426 bacterium]
MPSSVDLCIRSCGTVLLAAALLGLSLAPVRADDIALLDLGPGTRPAALGQAYVALADDVHAVFWNPAGLGYSRRVQAQFMHHQWLQNSTAEYLAAAYPVGPGTAGLACGLMQFGEFDAYDEYEQPQGSFSALEGYVSGAYGWSFFPGASCGAALKLPFSSLADDTRLGVNADVGAAYVFQTVPVIRAGAAVANFLTWGLAGSAAEIRLGLAIQEKSGLQLSVEADRRIVPGLWFLRMGAEYACTRWVALRLGHMQPLADSGLPGYGLTAGVGFHVEVEPLVFDVGYAYAPYGPLGQTHRLDLTAELPDFFRPAAASPLPLAPAKKTKK